MKNNEAYLFVYGTLRSGNMLSINDEIADDTEWVGASQIKGRLYDIGEYPGALPSNENHSIIKGEVLKLHKPRKVLRLLDKYEGYDRSDLKRSEYYRKKEILQLKKWQNS